MAKTDVTLDKKAHPLMMHLSIIPKYEIAEEAFSYDPSTQTSNITSMSNSWCTRSSSTYNVGRGGDEDQKEDD
ncbi:hypothetical protein [Oscillatoria acuminata]|uniref:Uncharacterized protein n=1 Tax=Oscillatoria acuminata PCC 6304 TaxID=56110 RepID=K9TM01_9CYAN|nr:hypothetical protein [Oscillatoria acuminata]AFY83560.1 hypothetical protein Oscil6304_4024 [Oscillatoria acuminata PCC 6304]